MSLNLHNRNFLKLLDFTPEEINYLLDLAAKLKETKHTETRNSILKGKILHLFLKKHQHAQDVLLKLRLLTRVPHVHILGLPDHRLDKKNR